jgi:hypothetical protein
LECYWGQIVGRKIERHIVERHNSGRNPIKGLLGDDEAPSQRKGSTVLFGRASSVSLLFEQQA